MNVNKGDILYVIKLARLECILTTVYLGVCVCVFVHVYACVREREGGRGPKLLLASVCASINPLNAELNPICHLLALVGAHHIVHVNRVRVKNACNYTSTYPHNFMVWC